MKNATWPKIKFRQKGPAKPSGGFPPIGFGWELHFYDFLNRWNGGVPVLDSFKVKNWNEEFTVARVKYFYGVSDDNHDRDLRHAVYHGWDDLPRGSVPIAEIDIEDDDWDRCTLLTFRWGENYNKIYLLANLHDCGPYDPDDLTELQYVARSLPQFIKTLKSYDHFCYRTWFQLPISLNELQSVANSLVRNGLEDNGEFSNIESDQCAQAYHEDPKFNLWLAQPGAKLSGVRAPQKVPKGSCLLAVDAFRWNQSLALKCIKSALKPLKLDRKLKKIGETAVNT